MKELDKLIKDTNMENVIKSMFKYEDDLPQESAGMPEGCELDKWFKMKYFDGSITRKEHMEFYEIDSEFVPAKIYDIIFNMDKSKMEDIEDGIKKEWEEELLELYFGLSDDSAYKKIFDILCTILCCKTRNEEFLGNIARSTYKNDVDVKLFVQEKLKNDLELQKIFRVVNENDEAYNRCYGKMELIIEVNKNEDNKLEQNRNGKDEVDWIEERFGA